MSSRALELIALLQEANEGLKAIQSTKDQLVEQLAAELKAPENKSKTFPVGGYKVTVTRGRNYKINIDRWSSCTIDEDIDPVRVVTKYEINKTKMAVFNGKYDNLYAEFMEWSPAKTAVTIKLQGDK